MQICAGRIAKVIQKNLSVSHAFPISILGNIENSTACNPNPDAKLT